MSKGSGDRDEGWNGLRPYGVTGPLEPTTVNVVQSVCNQRCPDPIWCMQNGCIREEDL